MSDHLLECHDAPNDHKSADWCAPFDDGFICGTRMVEHSRTSKGIKWCFRCRKRVEFQFVVMVPDGPSYYGPTGWMECANCQGHETDLFPGWSREYGEDASWSSAETAAATNATPDLTVDQWMWAQRGVHRALAAIDALRGES